MRQRLILVGVLAIALAACGGSSGSPSPSASGAGSSALESGSPTSPVAASPTASESVNEASPSAALPAAGSTSTAACGGIALRKSPSSSAGKVKVIDTGTLVHIVAIVSGTPYTANACGTSGSTWLKIDKVGGKSVKASYGVTYVYAAAGFFQ